MSKRILQFRFDLLSSSIIFFPLCIFVFNSSLYCQVSETNYSISFLTTKDGLRQGSNRFILEDKKGYMWISSQDGINRYNGKEIFRFNHPRFYENGKPFKASNRGLTENSNGDIWIGIHQGLYKYQQVKNMFKNFDVFQSSEEPKKVSKPFASVRDEIWVSD